MTLAANIAALPNGDDAPVYACRAWVNFDGTSTESTLNETNGGVRNSGNVTSVTNHTTGQFTITFTESMPHQNYVIAGILSNTVDDWSTANSSIRVAGMQQYYATRPSISSVRIDTMAGASGSGNATLVDFKQVTVAIFC